MEQKHNSVIKFDLHIHSHESAYKEKNGIVDNSTKENIHILLSKLNEHGVSLFSITDHNRFSVELYKTIIKELSTPNNAYPNVEAVLPGVEFDIKLEDNMEKCHVIAIFDLKNDFDKMKQIQDALLTDPLDNPAAFYTKDRFENILHAIGLDTILIASQRKDINNHSGNHNSLSDSSDDVEEIIRVGYIDALEFQKPKVEGILINNLKDLSLSMPLLSGSDCHDWSCYPYHDKDNQNRAFHHSKAKILPTFKGLLMAISSPETRFTCQDSTNSAFLNGINIGDKKVELVNGINAIIGENGSGKTTLLELINGNIKATYIKKLIANNKLSIDGSIDPSKIKYIEQGQIIEKFNAGTLFSSEEHNNFKELDNTSFEEMHSDFARNLYKSIKASIAKKQTIMDLAKCSVTFDSSLECNSYYINVICPKDFSSVSNQHEDALKNITDIIHKIEGLSIKEYFQRYHESLENILSELKGIEASIRRSWEIIDCETKIKNIMNSIIKNYNIEINSISSLQDKEVAEYKNKRRIIVDSVVHAIKVSTEKIYWPNEPTIVNGFTQNPKQGFYFNKEAAYNGVSVVETFYSKMFVKSYREYLQLQKIDTLDNFKSAIMNCTTISEIDTKWKENFQKFISESTQTKEYITDGTEQRIGNTLGEMSLSYYKFFTQENEECHVLIVDQPEDNISNNNISHKLISYFQAIRNEKQIIFVTHNPLLVVNLDVDNVIFVKNENSLITVNDGCLEYENEEINILELIAQNMDGGKETIEKRLKVYGKKY